MNQTQSIPWKRILIEAAAIVASILLAFSIDAWWEDRKTDQQRRDHIAALERDFEQMSARVQASYDASVQAVDSGTSLLVLLSGESDIELGLAISLLMDVGFYEVFSPSIGAYEALVASGGIELLRNDQLKRELASFFGSFNDMRVSEQLLVDSQARFFESPEFGRLLGYHRLGLYGQPKIGNAPVGQWRQSDQFLNGISAITTRQVDVKADYQFLIERISHIRKLITEEVH